MRVKLAKLGKLATWVGSIALLVWCAWHEHWSPFSMCAITGVGLSVLAYEIGGVKKPLNMNFRQLLDESRRGGLRLTGFARWVEIGSYVMFGAAVLSLSL